MALRLTIISNQGTAMGERVSVRVDKGICRIGRAIDNEWALPDSQRYISAHHARISYRNGSYIVEDTSTNGLFLNDDPEPVGRLGPQPLRPGDTLRLGPYRIGVRDDVVVAADASEIVAFATTPTDAGAGDLHRDIGVDLDISDLLVNEVDLSAARRGFDPWGNPIIASDPALLQFDSAQQAALKTLQRSAADAPSIHRPPASRPSGTRSVATEEETAAALVAFCRGAGMDSRRMPSEDQEQLLPLAGLLLREALVGIKELARTQREIRQGSGLQALADEPERVALQNLSVEDLLARLLQTHDRQQLDPVQWLRELFGVAIRHDAALMRALGPALKDFTQRLDPALLATGASAAERFRSITEMPEGRLPHLFAEALARSFNAATAQGTGVGLPYKVA